MGEVRKPYPKNVPGPVYVEDGCCMSCAIWQQTAAKHFTFDRIGERSHHCYVSQQPQTDEDFESVVTAIKCQELDCIRVRSCPQKWRARMIEEKLEEYLDDEPLNLLDRFWRLFSTSA